MAICRIFRGPPGGGKSTSAKRMFPGTLLLENDMFLISDDQYKWSKERVRAGIDLCMKMTEMALENNSDVVVANTFTKRRFIAAYEKLALKYGAKFEVYRCTGNYQNVHGLNDEMVASFKNAMEDWIGEIIL
jgi:predicted kinase